MRCHRFFGANSVDTMIQCTVTHFTSPILACHHLSPTSNCHRIDSASAAVAPLLECRDTLLERWHRRRD